MYDGMRSVGWFSAVYFVVVVVVGQMVFLNLFIAMLMNSFTDLVEQQKR